jgi:hypothetical protein
MVPAYKETTEPRGPSCQGVIPLQVLPLRSRVTPRAALVEEELLTIPIKSNTTGGSSGEGTASHSNQEYTTGGTSGGGTANHSRESEFTLSF